MNPSLSRPCRITIVGCGDLGQRLARQLRDKDYKLVGLRRSPLPTSGSLSYRQVNVTNLDNLRQALPTSEVVIVTMTPDERSDRSYQQAYVQPLQHLLTLWKSQPQSAPRLLLFVSSTRVYGQDQHQWVNENSPVNGSGFAAQRLLQAEALTREFSGQAVVVRFSGIYGPGRQRLLQQVQSGALSGPEPVIYTNRIHAEDCAAVLAHLVKQHRAGNPLQPLYLASDMQPTTLHEVHQWIASRLPGNIDRQTSAPPAQRQSRRCHNQRLLDSGFEFLFPTYREGYAQVIEDSLKGIEQP